MKYAPLGLWLVATPFLGPFLPTTIAAGIAGSTAAHTSDRGLRGGTADTPHTPRDLQKKPPSEPITCVGGIVDVQYGPDVASIGDDVHNPHHYGDYPTCETPSGKSFKLISTSHPVEAREVEAEIMVGMTDRMFDDKMPEILLPQGSIVNEATGTIDLPPGKGVSFAEVSLDALVSASSGANSRRDYGVMGTRSVLVVRVVAKDKSTTATVERLSDSVFGNGADGSVDTVTMRSQYLACSYDQLDFVEADDRNGRDINIRNGAVTVTVPSATSAGDTVIMNEIADILNAQFGVSSPSALADHVMMCMPPGTMSGIAFANVDSWRSWYDDDWCTHLSAQMHEVGHNIGLAHSNHDGKAYEDKSGVMGYAYRLDDGPKMCFNGPKSWQLGWYASRQHVFDLADGTWSGHLIGQVDYNSPIPFLVLIKLKTGLDTDYYVWFNRQTGMNSGTKEGGDQVMISRAGGEGVHYAESDLISKMSTGGSLTLANFDSSGRDLTLTVNSISAGAGTLYAYITIETESPPTPTPTPPPKKTCTRNDGTRCAKWTSCKECCNSDSWWWGNGSAGTKCGTEPAWRDGTKCLGGSTCKACKYGRKYWKWSWGSYRCGSGR